MQQLHTKISHHIDCFIPIRLNPPNPANPPQSGSIRPILFLVVAAGEGCEPKADYESGLNRILPFIIVLKTFIAQTF